MCDSVTVCSDWLAGRWARAFAYYVRQFVKQFVQLSHSVNAVLLLSLYLRPYGFTYTDKTRHGEERVSSGLVTPPSQGAGPSVQNFLDFLHARTRYEIEPVSF